jgi:N6-adenosine-specific RNA methylase IME4
MKAFQALGAGSNPVCRSICIKRSDQLELPDKKYNIIYADPPWQYNKRNNLNTKFSGGAGAHYPLMTMEEIKAISLKQIAYPDCVLFLWTTFPYLNEQIKLFDHWGFRYRTLGFSWIKTNVKNGKPCFGVGYYAKSNCEVCLMGMQGQLKPVSNFVSSVIISPRRKHSQKPDEVRTKIVELFGDLPRIELFAREKFEGWDSWGNEVN